MGTVPPDTRYEYFNLSMAEYEKTMSSHFKRFREDLSFVDVTLSCEHGSLKAHKIMLATFSPYFQKLLLDNPCNHPTIILPKDIIFTDLKNIINFIYCGEIDVVEPDLQGLLRAAEMLKIKGLCESAEETATQATVLPGSHSFAQQQQTHQPTSTAQSQQSYQQQQHEFLANEPVLAQSVTNVKSPKAQLFTTATGVLGQMIAGALPSQQQPLPRIQGARKRLYSAQQQQQPNQSQQAAQQQPRVTYIRNKNQTIFSLRKNSMGTYTSVSGQDTIVPASVTKHITFSCNVSTDTSDLINPTETLDIFDHFQSSIRTIRHQSGSKDHLLE